MPLIPPVHRPTEAPVTRSQPPAVIRVTVVESEGCHFCEDALRTLEGFAQDHELALDVVDIRSRTGQELTLRHRPSLTPLILVDGEFFSQGRLPRRKLAKLLAERGHRG
ncbi:MAG: glutaredoxin family protein [Nocardioides sp.]|nr:glutaredoxin family protein [Nocardioides sp.]